MNQCRLTDDIVQDEEVVLGQAKELLRRVCGEKTVKLCYEIRSVEYLAGSIRKDAPRLGIRQTIGAKGVPQELQA